METTTPSGTHATGIKNLPSTAAARIPRRTSRFAPPRAPMRQQHLRSLSARAWGPLAAAGTWNACAIRCSYPSNMKVAVISDIHANRHALRGDAGGRSRHRSHRSSGAWATSSATAPSRTPAWSSRASTRPCAWRQPRPRVTGELALDEFSRGAASPAQWTRRSSTPEPRLPEGPGAQGRKRPRWVSQSTPAPATPCGSTCSPRALASCAWTPSAGRICLIGIHTSRCPSCGAWASPRRRGAARRRAAGGRRGRMAAQPRSVGQPRDGDPRAAWLLLDLDAMTVPSALAVRHRRRRAAIRAARLPTPRRRLE